MCVGSVCLGFVCLCRGLVCVGSVCLGLVCLCLGLVCVGNVCRGLVCVGNVCGVGLRYYVRVCGIFVCSEALMCGWRRRCEAG